MSLEVSSSLQDAVIALKKEVETLLRENPTK
jgi:hypothetical protein